MTDAACKEHLESLFEQYQSGETAAAKEFAAYVRLNADVPIHAQQLLAYKIQSPLEKDARAGLAILECCVRNSGKLFHNEIGKYRFLNELIRVVSPKYLGPRSHPEVKKRIVEIMYSWTIGLKEQTKIADAYSMLKKQGIVKQDPKFDERLMMPTPPPPERCTLLKDEAEEARLHKLITSANPDDVALANEMIKTMYEKESTRIEKMGRKSHLIGTTEEKIKLCDDIINAGEAHSSQVLGQLYHDLEAIRPQLFRLTAETEDDNDELMLILRLTDEVTRIINVCKEKYPQAIAAATASPSTSSATISPINELLITTDEQSARLQELGCDLDLLGMDAPVAPVASNDQKPKSNPIDDLQQLNKAFMQSQFGYTAPQQPAINGAATLVDLTSDASATAAPPKSAPVSNTVIAPLTGITVPVTDFKPSKVTIQLCDSDGLRVLLIKGDNKLADRPDVTVLLITIDSTQSNPIENLIFNAKVAKPFRIKCLQPSGNEFAPFNPISSSSSRITQVLVMCGRPSEIGWTLSFDVNDESIQRKGTASLA